MACVNLVDLSAITIDCDTLIVGGLKKIYYTTQGNVIPTFDADGNLTEVKFQAADQVAEIGFNTKDGQSSFTDEKSVGAEGSESAVPTVTVFLPSMNASKATLIDRLANPYVKLVLFVETASGTKHMLGYDYGMTLVSSSGTSGASRPETNGYSLTFTGDEEALAVDASDAWDGVLTPAEPV